MNITLAPLIQQQFLLTPALKLSLEVLQMPVLQLQSFLQQQLDDNPALEVTDESNGDETRLDSSLTLPAAQGQPSRQETWQHEAGWTNDHDEDEPPYDSPAPPVSLHDHLLLQLRCLTSDPERLRAVETLLEWLDRTGYLRSPLEEIARSEGWTLAVAQRALALLQQCDPSGIGARSLQECLVIQLAARHEEASLAARIVRDHFELLAQHQWKRLASRLKVDEAQVKAAADRIATLEPKPARDFTADVAVPLIPDLLIIESQGRYEVALNDEYLPRLLLNARYQHLLRNGDTDTDTKQFLREKLRQALWVLKAIQHRQATLLSLARALVMLQHEYLLHGIGSLRALTQEEVAKHLGCHPSTVSRAIAGKTIQTPHGVLPLEAFFGGGIAHPEQEDVRLSSRSIQAELQQLIDAEPPARPFSDQALMERLRSRGYPVARRTVAKYRTALKILPAHLRRRTG